MRLTPRRSLRSALRRSRGSMFRRPWTTAQSGTRRSRQTAPTRRRSSLRFGSSSSEGTFDFKSTRRPMPRRRTRGRTTSRRPKAGSTRSCSATRAALVAAGSSLAAMRWRLTQLFRASSWRAMRAARGPCGSTGRRRTTRMRTFGKSSRSRSWKTAQARRSRRLTCRARPSLKAIGSHIRTLHRRIGSSRSLAPAPALTAAARRSLTGS